MMSLKLVGAMQVNGEPWDMATFGGLFERMKLVKHAGDPMRHVGFESGCGDVRFFGVAVEAIEDIPEGMVGWEIDSDRWVVTQPCGAVWRGESAWLWFDRLCGEFAASCPAEWVGSDSGRLEFRMTTNAYFARDRGPDDDVRLVDYDDSWPARYDEIAARVRSKLGPDVALRIEHYGSTAILGMPAKPVIDVLVEVPSFALAREYAIPAFDCLECEYWWYSEHMVFIVRDGFLGPRTHHIHVAPAGHEIWQGIAFRDYMISHPEDAARYAALKYELAERHRTDREEYTRAKTDFVKEITAKVMGCPFGG